LLVALTQTDIQEIPETLVDFWKYAHRANNVMGQRQRWILVGQEHQVHLSGLVLNDKGYLLVDGKRLDDMIIVDDKDERLGDSSDLIDQGGHQEICWGWLSCLE